jgi:hypothetical protein
MKEVILCAICGFLSAATVIVFIGLFITSLADQSSEVETTFNAATGNFSVNLQQIFQRSLAELHVATSVLSIISIINSTTFAQVFANLQANYVFDNNTIVWSPLVIKNSISQHQQSLRNEASINILLNINS